MKKNPMDKAMDMTKKDEKAISADPLGSYTGRTRDPHEKPVQDADDL